MWHPRPLLLLVALLGLGGCFDQKSLLKKIIPEAEDQEARHFLEAVRDGNLPEARGLLSSSLDQAAVGPGLETLRTLFNQSKWVETETIGYMRNWSGGTGNQRQTTTRLDYQIKLEKHWLAGTVIFLDEAASRKIVSARFNTIPASLESINAFTLSDKGLLHVLVLLFAILVPVFCLGTLVVCVRSRIRRKWLWVLFILVGVGSFTFNWSTGESGFQPLGFMLFGASMMKSGLYAPWMLGVAFPLGALLFVVRRKSLLLPAPVPPPPAPAI